MQEIVARYPELEAHLARLQREAAVRQEIAADDPSHPRVLGGPENLQNHPVMFELGTEGLDPTPVGREGDALAGEATVQGPIDLAERMNRAYVPMEQIPVAQAQLASIMGHGGFEMLPLEALAFGIDPMSSAGRARQADGERESPPRPRAPRRTSPPRERRRRSPRDPGCDGRSVAASRVRGLGTSTRSG